MTNLPVQYLGVRDELRPTVRGEIVPYRVVEFMVGPHGPFRVALPVDQFTPEKARELAEAEAQKIRALLG